ncbi:MAG: tRNA pseudouridine(55) synthase TruB [Dehalococcoidia bacterium]|nr:tRNA pseudouridine(55) synthase TruB [Dehalococcoidia bacterium]
MNSETVGCGSGNCCCSRDSVNGIININKPAGLTSFDVVARIRRMTRCKRTGHAGTLDPDATGVLLVCLGQATRMSALLGECRKTYVAEVQLGASTDTYDASGRVTSTGDYSGVDVSRLLSALAMFVGDIQQVPPMYSALKFRGKPLYQLARAGVQMELASRPIHVYRLDLVSWTPPLFKIEVECGKGTYVRSLAHDIGKELGCGAHLKTLVRTRCGGFGINDSIGLDELEEDVKTGEWLDHLHPIDSAALHLPAVILNDEKARMARSGRFLDLGDARQSDGSAADLLPTNSPCRAYDERGDFIAILEYKVEERSWHPYRVFSTGATDTCESLS